MARVLVMHPEPGPLSLLEARASRHHQVIKADSIDAAVRTVPKFRPELIVAYASARHLEALILIRRLKRLGVMVPVLVVVEPSSVAKVQPPAMHAGVAGLLEYPIEQDRFDCAVSSALQNLADQSEQVPPISAEESAANLTDLERTLNRKMVCVAGRNQVFIQSLILGGGRTSRPRIALKCPLRKQFGYKPDVYYEFIRDVCCADPSSCPAYQMFQQRMPS